MGEPHHDHPAAGVPRRRAHRRRGEEGRHLSTSTRPCVAGRLALPGWLVGVTLLAVATFPLAAQQVADTAFRPEVGPPRWPSDRGPHVVLDEAHHNFHTLSGRYLTFARLLRGDGFTVTPGRGPFTAAALSGVDVLVVANALNERNDVADEWTLPTPSAFTSEEIDAVRSWVEGGGSLLLIADHMPFPGAAHELAAAFGFELLNGFALDSGVTAPRPPMVFRRSDGSLGDHPVTNGTDPAERVDSVATFTGEAFRAPAAATSLLTFGPGTLDLLPDTAWFFHDDTPRVDVSGWSQGAVLPVGRGRVAVFGEAAMFSAQLAGPAERPMGMNAPVASGNPRFLLNLMHWLAGAGH
jgi:hypothetical protein